MKLATFRQPDSDAAYPGATFAAVITSVHPEDPEVAVRAVALPDCRDVGEYLTATPEEQREMVEGALRAAQADRSLLLDTSGLVYDTLVPFPTKVFCVGLNYTNHIDETGLERPEHPTLFAKFPQSLTGALDPIEVPEEDHRVDYEGELCIVVGDPGRRIAVEDAPEHIAGYAVANDISMRGFQGRTSEWLQGKVWEASTPVGPWLVTPDEFPADARVLTHVNGELRQEDRVADVVFSPAELVSYASQLITLNPGDLILTGTPAGRAGTALARAIARIPRLSPGTAAPRVMVAGTRRPAAVQRHLTIYAPEAVAVSAEDLAAEAELVVVAVPREALDDVDPLALAGPATRAVVDLTNTWGDEPVPAWLDDDGAPGSVRIAARWAAAGLCVPVVRAFSEISHHDLEDAGRATAPRRALAVGTERTDAAPEPAAVAAARDTVVALVTAMGFDAVPYTGLDRAGVLEPGAAGFGTAHDAGRLAALLADAPTG